MKLLESLLRRPRLLLAALLLLTVICLPLLRRLDLRGDLVDLLPRSSQAAQTFAKFTRDLGAGQELIVLVTGADPQALVAFADAYAAALRQLPDVQQVTYRISAESLTYLRDHLLLLLDDGDLDELGRRLEPAALRDRAQRLRALLSAPGGSAMAPLLLADPLELVPLVARRLSASSGLPVDAGSGYLRTAAGTALIMKVRPSFEPLAWERGEKLLVAASRLAESLGAELATQPRQGTWASLLRRLGPLGRDLQVTSFADGPRPKVSFTGSYAFPPHYRRWLEQDMTISTVLSVGSVLLLFGLFFRSLRILPVVLLPLGIAGLWTAISAAVFFGRLSGVSMAFASILVAIGIDVPIQIYNRLREELGRRPDTSPQTVVREVVCLLAGPAAMATLGPAVVFLACGLSDYKGLNQLGVLAGLGLILNCIAMLTLFPALLLVLPSRFWHRLPKLAAPTRSPLWALGRLGARHPRLVLMLALGTLLCALPWARRIEFSERLFALEPGDMPPALAQAEISRRFGEQQRFLVALIEDSDPDRALWRGDLWQTEAERLRQAGLLRGYEAIATMVPSAATQARRRARLEKLQLPAAAAQLQQALDQAGFDTAPFAESLERLRQAPGNLTPLTLDDLGRTELGFLVRSHVAELAPSGQGPEPDKGHRLVAVYLFAPADEHLGAAVTALRRFAAGPAGGALTGLPLLEDELRHLLTTDLLRVTGASLLAVVVMLLLYYRRGRPFLAVFLPLSVAWVMFAAALALLHIPLNLYNLLAVPLCIGYGIDDHIFLVHRHEATPAAERDPAVVLSTTGRAIVLTTLATVAGFAGLLPAHFVGLQLLGLSGALAVGLCLLAAFLVLPALLQLLWPGQGRPEQR